MLQSVTEWNRKKINDRFVSDLFPKNITRNPSPIMLLNKELLDILTAQAKASPRLWQHFDLRNSEHMAT